MSPRHFYHVRLAEAIAVYPSPAALIAASRIAT
jgi:hypothetical protein